MRDAGTQCYHTITSKLSVILGIIAVIGMTAYVGYIQVQHYKQTEDYCNNKYGVNGWELNETTGTGVNKYYIGQVWECVPLSNSSSDKSESFNKDLTGLSADKPQIEANASTSLNPDIK